MRGHSRPVRIAAEVGNGRQHVPRVAPLGRHCRIGRRRSVQVERKVARQALVREDIAQQFPITRAHDDLMVRHVLVPAVGAEVDHHQRHAVAPAANTRICLRAPRPRGQ